MDRLFKNKNKRKKSPEPPQSEIPTDIPDRPPGFRAELGTAPKGGQSLSYQDPDVDWLTVAPDEGSSRGSRITFHDERNERQGLTAPKTLTPGVVVDGTQHGFGHLGECF